MLTHGDVETHAQDLISGGREGKARGGKERCLSPLPLAQIWIYAWVAQILFQFSSTSGFGNSKNR